MKKIAVIGFRKEKDFIDWCERKQLYRISQKVYQDFENHYYGIFDYIDMTGQSFDDYIEIDLLKEDLMRRIIK